MDDSNTLIPRQDRVVCSGNTRYDIATGRCEIPPDGDGAKSLENPLGIVTSRTTNLSTATLAMGEADSTTTIIRASNSPDVQTTRVLSENGVGLQASPTVTLANTSSIPTNAATVISNDSNGNRLSSGAVAGIAIGTLLVGAILAFFAAMFVFKRRQRSRAAGMGNAKGYTSYADSSPELVTIQQAKMVNVGGPNSPYVQVSQSPIPSTMATAVPVTLHHRRNLSEGNSSFLPPAAHDTVIHSRVSALFNNLHRHVETYYRDVHATITPSMESDLARFGAKGNNMVEMVQDCSAPTTALKHAIVAYVLGITSASSKNAPDPTSLFPSALVSPRRDASADANLAAATNLHRRLSVYIYKATSPSSARATQSGIREAAEHFSLTFFPWANPVANDQDKDQDLTRLISDALDISIWLYGQPHEYEFDWEGIGRRGVLVSPGLVRNHEDDKRDWIIEGVVVGL